MKLNKKLSLIIAVFLLVVIIFGGTLAYYQWSSGNTAVNFTVSADGMGHLLMEVPQLQPAH